MSFRETVCLVEIPPFANKCLEPGEFWTLTFRGSYCPPFIGTPNDSFLELVDKMLLLVRLWLIMPFIKSVAN